MPKKQPEVIKRVPTAKGPRKEEVLQPPLTKKVTLSKPSVVAKKEEVKGPVSKRPSSAKKSPP